VREARLAVEAQGENAAGHADRWLRGFERRGVRRPVFLEQLLGCCGPIEFVRKGFVPERLNLGKLFLALKKLIDWIKR
jgi:hypothetical protein